MPRLEAASISITSSEPPAGDFEAAGAHAAGLDRSGPCTQFRQRARMRATVVLPGAALAGKNVAVRDAVLRDGVFERGLDVLLVDHIVERLRPVFAGDDLIHGDGRMYARPRVIRGTRVKPLPLLPSGPGGVCSRPLHGARNLTITYASTWVTIRRRTATYRPRDLESSPTQKQNDWDAVCPRRKSICTVADYTATRPPYSRVESAVPQTIAGCRGHVRAM